MANLALINQHNIHAFQSFLITNEWIMDTPRTQWEILRMYKKPLEPVIVYTRKNNPEGIYSVHGETAEQAKLYLASVAEETTTILQELNLHRVAVYHTGGPEFNEYEGEWVCRTCNAGAQNADEIKHEIYPRCCWKKAKDYLDSVRPRK